MIGFILTPLAFHLTIAVWFIEGLLNGVDINE